MTSTEPDTTHQGFTNYETFSVAITLDTDRGSHDFWHERTREALAQHDDPADAALVIADALKDTVEEGAPELDGFYGSLLFAGMSEVDYFDIARHWIDDVMEES